MEQVESIPDIRQAHCPNQFVVLATLINVERTHPCQPLASRLLMAADGKTIYALDDCPSQDIYLQAQAVMQTGEPCLVSYPVAINRHTNRHSDRLSNSYLANRYSVQRFSSNAKSRLRIDERRSTYVLIERTSSALLNPVAFSHLCFQRRQSGAIATVFRSDDLAQVGTHLFFNASGDAHSVVSSLTDLKLIAIVTRDVRAALCQKRSAVKRYLSSSGLVEVFIEFIHPQDS